MTERPIRWGILGTGKVARAFANALRLAPGARLAAVASRDAGAAEAFGREFGAARWHGFYRALAEDEQVDVVYIATPHPLHAENALMCLQAGRHVLCEKPFTMNRLEAAEVVALARSKQLFLMEAMWTRFLPAALEARRIIASGELGRVHQIQADFGFVASVGPQHRLLNRELGGGALLDIGVYPLSLAAFFLGPVESVRALAEIGPSGVDSHTAFTLRHRGGGLSSCICSLRVQTPTEMTISGELGTLRLPSHFHRAHSLVMTLADGHARTLSCPHLGHGYAHEAIEVMRCLRAGLGESPLMPHAETLALMGVLDTIRSQIGLTYSADPAHT